RLCRRVLLLVAIMLPPTTLAATLPSGFQESIVFSGLTNPTAVRFASDGRVFVAEKSGLIKVFASPTAPPPPTFPAPPPHRPPRAGALWRRGAVVGAEERGVQKRFGGTPPPTPPMISAPPRRTVGGGAVR